VYEESAIKLSEKESFKKSFTLFFLVIELFLGFIFYHYRTIEEKHIKERLALEMKNYALFFKGDTFNIDIAKPAPNTRFYELYEDTDTLYMLVPFPQGIGLSDALKIYYPKSRYLNQIKRMHRRLLWQFIGLSIVAVLISLLFSWYVLKPMKDALDTLETFMKDIIHDLNTPLTTMLINLKMMEKNEETRSIEASAHTLAMLQRNLDAYLKERIGTRQRFPLKEVIDEQVAFFKPLYERLTCIVTIDDTVILHTDRDAFSRIVYNLISNACKHNIPDGYVSVSWQSPFLHIENSSRPVRQPERLLERFYKESERGLGIGLHIVKKLSEALGISLSYRIEKDTVRFSLDLSLLLK